MRQPNPKGCAAGGWKYRPAKFPPGRRATALPWAAHRRRHFSTPQPVRLLQQTECVDLARFLRRIRHAQESIGYGRLTNPARARMATPHSPIIPDSLNNGIFNEQAYPASTQLGGGSQSAGKSNSVLEPE